MDPADIIDLDDIPSDAFDLDERDLDGSRSPSVNDDDGYSSWPDDSSPAPGLGEFDDEEEEEEDEEDGSVEEQDDEEEEEDEDGVDLDEDEDEDDGDIDDHDLGMGGVYMDPLAPLDPLDVPDLDMVDWRPHDGIVENLAALLPHWNRPPSPSLHARRLLDRASNLLAAFQAPQHRPQRSESPSDALFVAQLRHAFPPIDVDALIGPAHPHEGAHHNHHHHHRHHHNQHYRDDFAARRRSRSLRPQNNQQHRAPALEPFGRVTAAAGPSRENRHPNHNQIHNHNHQPAPYNNMSRRNHRDRPQGSRQGSRARDELVELEVEVQPARRDRASAAAEQEVIDLTNEPDSPGSPPAHGAVPAAQPRNRHRRRPDNRRPSPLARGDNDGAGGGGNQAAVIDLTLDDDDDAGADPPPRPQHLPRRTHPENHNNNNNPANNRHLRHGNHRQPTPFAHRIPLIDLEQEAGFNANINNLVRDIGHMHQRIHERFNLDPPQHLSGRDILLLGARAAAAMANPIGNAPVQLDYNAGAARGSPKHVPPPAARPGFTRDTRGSSENAEGAESDADDDEVFICPGCEQELAYDPDDDNSKVEEGTAKRPSKKPRTRKDREEHHFWALKDCGHVYCRDCYESRGARPKNPGAKFRRHPEHPRKVLCAVEECTTETSSKANWVGLFL